MTLASCDAPVLAEELAESADMFMWEGYDLEVLQLKDRPGFKPFVAQNKEALKALAAMRNEQEVLVHLGRNTQLLEGVAHVRAWYFDRHLAACKSKTASMAATVQDEAAGFFLLDAAADAARNAFMQMPTPDIKKAAVTGVNLLAAALLANGDAVGVRSGLSMRIQAWTAMVKQAAGAAQAKQQMKSKWAMKSKSNKAGESAAPAVSSSSAAAAPMPMPRVVTTIPEEHEAEASAEVATGGAVESKEEEPPAEAEKPSAEDDGGLAGLWKSWFG